MDVEALGEGLELDPKVTEACLSYSRVCAGLSVSCSQSGNRSFVQLRLLQRSQNRMTQSLQMEYLCKNDAHTTLC